MMAIVKDGPNGRTIDTQVNGIGHREKAMRQLGRVIPWAQIKKGDEIELREDPYGKTSGNTHQDPNALMVWHRATATWLGFVPNNENFGGKVADAIRRELDEGMFLYSCRVSAITGTDAKPGVRLEIDLRSA